MSNVITFTDIRPPVRVDGVAWTQIKIQYAEERDGAYEDVETVSISPLDTDPRVPIARNFSTTLAPAAEGWFKLVFLDNAGHTAESDEFFIEAEKLSEIAALVKSLMPSSYEALATSSTYGEPLLQLRIKAAKYERLPVTLADADESSYSFGLKNYIASVAAMQLIPAAIDHWMRQKIQVSATGTNENVSFPNPIEALKELEKRLLTTITMAEANPDLIALTTRQPIGPALDNEEPVFVTEDPFEFPQAFQPATGTTVAA